MRERPGQNRSGGGDLGRNRARPKPPGDGKWTSSCKSSVGAAALGGLSSGTGRGPVRGFYAGEGLCPGLSAGSPASLGKRAGTEARPYRRYDRCKVPVPTLILRNKCVNRHGQKNGPQPASPVLIPPQTRRIAAEQEKFLAYRHSLNFHPQAGNKKDTGLSPHFPSRYRREPNRAVRGGKRRNSHRSAVFGGAGNGTKVGISELVREAGLEPARP